MSTFVLIHGAGDGGWYWHLVEAELRGRGHDVVAPDLPCEDDAGLEDYADAVVEAVVGDRRQTWSSWVSRSAPSQHLSSPTDSRPRYWYSWPG